MLNLRKTIAALSVCIISLFAVIIFTPDEKPNYSSSALTAQAASSDITADDVIAVARSYIGSYGQPFMKMFAPNLEFPYCSAFVAGVYEFAGFAPNEMVGHTTFVDETADGMYGQVQYFAARGRCQPSVAYGGAYYIPQKGDVIVFCWDIGANKGSHVGIVTYSDGYYVWTIESNTSDGTVKGSCYKLDSPYIMCFGKVKFPNKSSETLNSVPTVTTTASTTTVQTTASTTAATAHETSQASAQTPSNDTSFTSSCNSYGVIEITSDIGCRVHSGASIGSPCIGIASTFKRITFDYTQGEFFHVIDCDVENSIYTVNGFIHNSVCRPISQHFVQVSSPSDTSCDTPSASQTAPKRGRILSPIGAWQRWAPELSDGMYSAEDPGEYDTRQGILNTFEEFDIIEECGNGFYKIRSDSFGIGYVHYSVMEILY